MFARMVLRDAYGAALVLQEEFGDRAADVADERADKCLVKGDTAGFRDWSRISEIIRHIEESASRALH